MECGLQWKDITCWEDASRLTLTHEETLETAIADYCPDMGRVVETAGQLCLRSIVPQGDGVELRGTIQVTVLYTSEDIQQRAAMVLQDVHYVIECHFDLTDKAAPSDNPGKFQDILRRRLRKGQCYHQPCFGCREFPANFREWPGGSIPALKVTQDLGFMLHSLDYSDSANIRSQFFRAKLVDGVMECRDVEVFT